jgi:hypothetical protein
VCLRVCGEIFRFASEGQVVEAALTAARRRFSTPERVSRCPRRFGKTGSWGGSAAAGEPVLEQSRCALPERHLPLFATLAEHANPSPSIEFDVFDVEAEDLRDARASVVGNGQKHEVSVTAPGAAVGRRKHGVHLGPREEPEQRLVVPFHRDREAALQYGQFHNVARARVVQERSNRGQPRIACTNGVTPLFL